MRKSLEPDHRIMALEACMLLWLNRGETLGQYDKKLDKVRQQIRKRIRKKALSKSRNDASLWERYQRKYITVKARHTIVEMMDHQNNFLLEYKSIPEDRRVIDKKVQKEIIHDLYAALTKSKTRKNRLNPVVEKWREAIENLINDFNKGSVTLSDETQECLKGLAEDLEKLLTVSYT